MHQHMICDYKMFNSLNSNAFCIMIISQDNGKGKVVGLGKIAISTDLSISNVLLVEYLNFNLLSVAQLCDLGFKYVFSSEDVEITMLMEATSSSRVYT